MRGMDRMEWVGKVWNKEGIDGEDGMKMGDFCLTVFIPILRVFFADLYQQKTFANDLCQSWENSAKIMHTNNR